MVIAEVHAMPQKTKTCGSFDALCLYRCGSGAGLAPTTGPANGLPEWQLEDLCKIDVLLCGAPGKHEESTLQRYQTMGGEKEASFKRWRMEERKITFNALPAIQEAKKALPGYISFCCKAMSI